MSSLLGAQSKRTSHSLPLPTDVPQLQLPSASAPTPSPWRLRKIQMAQRYQLLSKSSGPASTVTAGPSLSSAISLAATTSQGSSFSVQSTTYNSDASMDSDSDNDFPVPVPPVTIASPVTGALQPQPPNWHKHYEETILSGLPYKAFSISPDSAEFHTIAALMSPIETTAVEQIVNPFLWRRYTATKKEMICSKTDNLKPLSQERAFPFLNVSNNVFLETEAGKYSPHETLLFHCSKNPLESILTEGLDERLARGGTLGKGIYFADDPKKSIGYDRNNTTVLIFAVLLGDCLSVDHLRENSSRLREPEKVTGQMRNSNDLFFDSITARLSQYNEYVIFNRYQCCPLYRVRYKNLYEVNFSRRGSDKLNTASELNEQRNFTPTVAWRNDPRANYPIPNQLLNKSWPFFASNIFKKMGAGNLCQNSYEKDDSPVAGPSTRAYQDVSSSPAAPLISSTNELREKHLQLVHLGFPDWSQNKVALRLCRNDLNDAAAYLLDASGNANPQQSSTSGSVTSVSKAASSVAVTTTVGEDVAMKLSQSILSMVSSSSMQEECQICCEKYSAFIVTPYLWKELKCGHKFCKNCEKKIRTTGTTMHGARHISTRCPFCLRITGTAVGSCPPGKMTVTTVSDHCEGYEDYNALKINYVIQTEQHSLNRSAYLPNSPEGKEVLTLLRTAWERRLTFTIDTSLTTGERNVLVWNIHHKSSLRGGAEKHGYPDPGYLGRVKNELKMYDIM